MKVSQVYVLDQAERAAEELKQLREAAAKVVLVAALALYSERLPLPLLIAAAETARVLATAGGRWDTVAVKNYVEESRDCEGGPPSIRRITAARALIVAEARAREAR